MREDNPKYPLWKHCYDQIAENRDPTYCNQPRLDVVTISNYASAITNAIYNNDELSQKMLGRNPKKFIRIVMADDEVAIQTKKTILNGLLSYTNYAAIRKYMRTLTVQINDMYSDKGWVGKEQTIPLARDVKKWFDKVVSEATDRKGLEKFMLFYLVFMCPPRRAGAYGLSDANKKRWNGPGKPTIKSVLYAGDEMSAGRFNYLYLDPKGQHKLIMNAYKTKKVYGRRVVDLAQYKVYNVYKLDVEVAESLVQEFREKYYTMGEPIWTWSYNTALSRLKSITIKSMNFNVVRKALCTRYLYSSRLLRGIASDLAHTLKTQNNMYLLSESYDKQKGEIDEDDRAQAAADAKKARKKEVQREWDARMSGGKAKPTVEESESEESEEWAAPPSPKPSVQQSPEPEPESDSEPTPAPVVPRKRMNTRPRRRVAKVASYSRSHR
jgi:hypothetical protein